MQRWRGYEAAPSGWGRSVVTIGTFDGVHMGHQATIGHAVERAKEMELPSLVLTFDPHPSEVVRPGSHPAVLTSPSRKAELISGLGVDVLCVQPFTLDFSRMSAEQFVHDLLVEHLHAALVVVGENFRFGHRAAGDVPLLTRLGRTFGFAVEPAPLVSGDGMVYSSTYVRACVDAGDVETAARVLGRPHRIEGVVVRGDQRGRQLGFPTANLLTARFTAIPADGVYAAWLARGGQRLPAAVSIGTNPTFAGQERRVEAYVLDFDGDLYGERLALDFVARLRAMEKFDGLDQLVAAIADDVARTRQILG
ncbi:bifunctional riboflavin kinase/FAD synthetase [Allorhizocola rhizosphaerae]|uniref:bifunctional riboflavin kinase/FAD synthetase n=1 Tax=Allorhizocola rhizosphaerae TaxID=1872709 RepID=UPI000E3DE4DE|nr:bifunctional riboflavin kinase/FAD synthetase [Allorhizocola rhizosphaerae]